MILSQHSQKNAGQTIDCLIIGCNDMDFKEYEKSIRKMGYLSGAYRDLELNFIRCHRQLYHASGLFNLFLREPLRMGEIFSPALAYLGTYLHRQGFTFDYVNSFQDEKEELAEKLQKKNLLTIAVTTTLYVSAFPILEIMDFIKKNNQAAKVIIGGPFVSTQVRNLDPPALDYLLNSLGADIYVNSSQGEAALVDIIRALKSHLPLNSVNVNNIYYKVGSGYKTTPVKRENNPLSENMVDWELFTGELGKTVNVRTSISCPFSCAFCGFPEHAGSHQTANVEAIAYELNALEKMGTVNSVYFIDDTMNIPPQRFKDILHLMARNNYSFKWQCNFRCQFADRETIRLMKECKCQGVFLGIESGNQHILKNMNKKAAVEKYLEGIELLKEYGIVTFGSFIVGFPGETEKTVQDTIHFIKTSGIDFFRTQLWYCEPITPIWKQRHKYNLKGENFEWTHATMNSREACDLVYEIFLTIDKPTWVPQYNFDFDHIFQLTDRGFSLGLVKQLLENFNRLVRAKITHPAVKETDFAAIKPIKELLTPLNVDTAAAGLPGENEMIIDFDLD